MRTVTPRFSAKCELILVCSTFCGDFQVGGKDTQMTDGPGSVSCFLKENLETWNSSGANNYAPEKTEQKSVSF